MMTEDLFRTLADADFGDWSERAVADVMARLGWTDPPEWRQDTATWERADGAYALSFRTPDYERDYEFGDLRHLSITYPVQDVEEAHREQREIARAVLGPPPFIGGPDAYLRWRRPATSLELSRDVRSSTIRVDAEPTKPAEWLAHTLFKGGEPQEYAWRAYLTLSPPYDKALDGAMLYPPPLATDWKEFADHLETVFTALAEDVPTLHEWTGDILWIICAPDDRFVQGYFAADTARFEVSSAGDVPDGVDFLASADGGADVAREAMATISEWGVDSPERLSLSCWAEGRADLERLLGLPAAD